MPLIAYREQRFNSKARRTVEQAKVIIDDLQAQGYTLTLRQLYYQFVSKNLIANSEQEYKRLGRILTDAREVGEIDWLAIEDRGRQCLLHGHQDDAQDVLDGIEAAIRLNPWLEQDVYLESWIEKSALEGVLERPANRWRSPYMACKGYLSASEAWRAGRRFERAIAAGKRPVLIHLGDHDPSGKDMTRDNGVRLELFARSGVEVVRVALNMDQVEQYKPPPNPAKLQDSRAEGYVAQYGSSSWELDALSPKVIDDLVSDRIKSYIDMDRWDATLKREAELRVPLMNLGHRWDEVRRLAQSGEMPLERLARLDPLVLELTGASADVQAGLLDRLGSRCMAEGLHASAATREAALEALKEVGTHRVVGKDLVTEPIPIEEVLEEARALIGSVRDAPPSEGAVALRDEAASMVDRLQAANVPDPAPLRPEDGDPEPDATEDDADDDIDPLDEELFGPERD